MTNKIEMSTLKEEEEEEEEEEKVAMSNHY